MEILKRDVMLKKVLIGCSLVYFVTLVYAFYYNYSINDMQSFKMGIVAIFTPLIIPIIFKLFKLKRVYEIDIINVVFVYFASLIGSCLGGYSWPYFDKVVHFISGLIFALVAIMVFSYIKKVKRPTNREDYTLFILFINFMNLAIAVLWEFYEYAMLIFFQNDCINHYSTGVHDSITDMLCAFVAGLLITVMIMRCYKKNKSNFLINLCDTFYIRNIEK